MATIPVKHSSVMIAGIRHSYRIRRSKRARQLLLHVDFVKGVEVVLPYRMPWEAGERLIQEKRSWLSRALDRQMERRAVLPQITLEHGSTLPYLGRKYKVNVRQACLSGRLANSRLPGVEICGDRLLVYVNASSSVRRLLERWYRDEARKYFTAQCSLIAQYSGKPCKKISIRNQKTRWGSCTGNNLSFNWRLLLGPRAVAQYVAVHEMAHLRYHDHSKNFWKVVEELLPHYRQPRRWLRDHGFKLVF